MGTNYSDICLFWQKNGYVVTYPEAFIFLDASGIGNFWNVDSGYQRYSISQKEKIIFNS
jgi:hypothetical protein